MKVNGPFNARRLAPRPHRRPCSQQPDGTIVEPGRPSGPPDLPGRAVSPSPDRIHEDLLARRGRADRSCLHLLTFAVAPRADGFTLIEVMVALGIFLVVTAAVVPQIVVGLRASAAARDITQTKGVAQARLEVIAGPALLRRASGRRLQGRPGHLLPRQTRPDDPEPAVRLGDADGAAAPRLDGLRERWRERHRRPLPVGADRPALPQGDQPGGLARPRRLLHGRSPRSSSRRPPRPSRSPPIADYDTKTSEPTKPDTPAASQIGVTVAVFYPVANGFRSTVTYTQVERANPMAPLLTSEAKANTLRVSSALNADTNLLEQLGVINLSGELFTGSRAITTASAALGGHLARRADHRSREEPGGARRHRSLLGHREQHGAPVVELLLPLLRRHQGRPGFGQGEQRPAECRHVHGPGARDDPRRCEQRRLPVLQRPRRQPAEAGLVQADVLPGHLRGRHHAQRQWLRRHRAGRGVLPHRNWLPRRHQHLGDRLRDRPEQHRPDLPDGLRAPGHPQDLAHQGDGVLQAHQAGRVDRCHGERRLRRHGVRTTTAPATPRCRC